MISGPTATCICQENEYAWDVEATLRKIRMFSPPMNLYFEEKRKLCSEGVNLCSNLSIDHQPWRKRAGTELSMETEVASASGPSSNS